MEKSVYVRIIYVSNLVIWYSFTMKQCSKCRLDKVESEYFVKSKATGKLHAQCKLCYKEHRRSYHILHYSRYGDAYRERARLRRARIKYGLRINMLKYLQSKACIICGEDDMRVLDFDHIEPLKKEFSISSGITKGYDWEKILAEISKCRILCSNCHRKHTAIQGKWYKNYQ